MTVSSLGRRLLPSAAALISLLSACSSFQIIQPTQDAITGIPTTVHVTANPQMSQLSVRMDQTDITNKIATTTTDGVGQVNVTPGRHTVTAAAMVGSNDPYSWPQPTYTTDSKQFCASQPRPAAKTVTPLAFADGKTWVNGASGVSLGPDASDGSARWWLANAIPNGYANHNGQIKWGGGPDCRCISSDGVLHGAPPISDCDSTIVGNTNPNSTQTKQLWDSQLAKSVGNKTFYYFANLYTNLCLSEHSGQLTQENCDSTFADTSQLWSLRDNGSGMLSSAPNPWFIDPYP